MGVMGMRTNMRVVLCFLLLAVTGCGTRAVREWMNRITPPEDDALARDLIAALLREDYGFIVQNTDERALGDAPATALRRFYLYVDHEAPRSVELVACGVFSSGSRRRSDLTYQLEFPHSWYTARVVIETNADVRKALGLQLKKLPASLAEINALTLKGKSLIHCLALLGGIGVPIFILYALIQCIRTRVKWKWLWIPFILIGIGSIQLNWTTGQLGLQPLSLHIPGAALTHSGLYGPWILSVSFPLGAILFLRKRRRLVSAVPSNVPRRLNAEETPPQSANDDPSPKDPGTVGEDKPLTSASGSEDDGRDRDILP